MSLDASSQELWGAPLVGFPETGEVALDKPPGRVRGAFLGDRRETCSKRPSAVLNGFFNGELGIGHTNVGFARVRKKITTH